MHPPLVTEVVEEHTLAVEANIILLTSVTTEVEVEEEDFDKLEDIILTILRNHNTSYVANLVIQLRPATTYLISLIRVLRVVATLL
jgi:hypothetical protein